MLVLDYFLAFLAAGFLAADFFAAGFLATAFLAGAFFAAGFLAATFLAAGFLAATFFAAGFLAATFLTAAFLAAGFLAAAFFAAGLAAAFTVAGFLAAIFFFGAAFLVVAAFMLFAPIVIGSCLPGSKKPINKNRTRRLPNNACANQIRIVAVTSDNLFRFQTLMFGNRKKSLRRSRTSRVALLTRCFDEVLADHY